MPTPPSQGQQPPQQAPASPDLGSFGGLPDAAPQKGAAAAAGAPAGPDLGSFANLPAPAGPPPGVAETVLDQATRGASLGFAPQLMGAITGAEGAGKYMLSTMKPGSGASWSGLGEAAKAGYVKGRDALRADYDQETAAHPAISRVADIGGSLGGALISGGTNLLGSAAERLAPKMAGNMLGRVITRGTLPAIEAGAERAIGETRDNNYGGNVARSLPASALLGSLFGAAGQLGGRLAEARAGAAAKGGQYAASDAAEINSPELAAKLRDYIDRPGFAKAYQKAVDDALDAGNPLPELPMRPSQAPLGNVEPSTGGTAPSPFPSTLSVRLIDALKRKVDMFHSTAVPPAERIGDEAYTNFYKDIIRPADQAVPVFGAARGSAEKVIEARKLAAMLAGAYRPTGLGGLAGFALGHSPTAAGLGAVVPLAARVGHAMYNQSAAMGAVPDATAALSRALAAAAARHDAQP